jgi:N-acetylmuramoyl-L-alanine amidase
VIRLADIDVLARTVMGEARGESTQGKWAVARCIVNRWKMRNRWFSAPLIAEVCQKPSQFSCWNRNDPNRQVILDATYDKPALCHAMRAAMDALTGSPHLWLTDNVTHYHADTIATPFWAEGHTPAGRIGRHIFFAGID